MRSAGSGREPCSCEACAEGGLIVAAHPQQARVDVCTVAPDAEELNRGNGHDRTWIEGQPRFFPAEICPNHVRRPLFLNREGLPHDTHDLRAYRGFCDRPVTAWDGRRPPPDRANVSACGCSRGLARSELGSTAETSALLRLFASACNSHCCFQASERRPNESISLH